VLEEYLSTVEGPSIDEDLVSAIAGLTESREILGSVDLFNALNKAAGRPVLSDLAAHAIGSALVSWFSVSKDYDLVNTYFGSWDYRIINLFFGFPEIEEEVDVVPE
jgi:hypothetical protein